MPNDCNGRWRKKPPLGEQNVRDQCGDLLPAGAVGGGDPHPYVSHN
jgi:hypothetical protein